MKQEHLKQTGIGQGIKRQLHIALAFSGALALSACGGGASNTQNPNPQDSNVTGTGTTTPYSGPSPTTTDRQNFKINLWENIRSTSRCGNCHDGSAGHQSGGVFFADNSNVNDAYDAVINNALVNLSRPDQSRMVAKFSDPGNPHFCGDGSNSVCRQELINWITAWANANLGGDAGRTIQYVAPNDTPPTAAIPLPTDHTPSSYYTDGSTVYNNQTVSATSIYNLVSVHCYGCHSAEHPQNKDAIAPQFAVKGQPGDIDKSYQTAAAVPLINLSNPTLSRFYTRLSVDGHNCWSDCASNAIEMEKAILMLKDQVVADAGGANPLQGVFASQAVSLLADGIEASGGSRYESSQIALYEFKVGSGGTALDSSGIDPAANLTLSGSYEWLSNWGIQFDAPAPGQQPGIAQAIPSDSAKLKKMIGLTGEYSIEAWVVPANVTQKDSNIVSYSSGPGDSATRNFTLGQNMDEYETYNYSSATDPTGKPVFATANKNLVATLQHVVVTYDPVNGREIYVNGVLVAGPTTNPATPDPTQAGSLTSWDSSLSLVVGNETTGDRPWLGAVRLLAIHNRALTQNQIKQNFDAGVGQKYYLLFNISHLIQDNTSITGCTGIDANNNPVSYCYIVMEASQFDNHSYLFNAPHFVNLNDANANISGSLLLKGMRIAINGVEAPSGQAYANLDACVNINGSCGDANETDASYTAGTGAPLSDLGTVIAMQNGPKPAAGSGLLPDQIFLTFQDIGGVEPTTKFVESSPTTPYLPPVAVTTEPDVLMHTFEEINATLAQLTGIPRTNTAVNNDTSLGDTNDGTYTKVMQALPSSSSVNSFKAAQQMAISQLAVTYCSELVNNTSKAMNYFGISDFTSGLTLDSSTRDTIIANLLSHVLNVDTVTPAPDLITMPDKTVVHDYLDALMAGGIVSINGTSVTLPGLMTGCNATTNVCDNQNTVKILTATCAAAMSSSPTLLN